MYISVLTFVSRNETSVWNARMFSKMTLGRRLPQHLSEQSVCGLMFSRNLEPRDLLRTRTYWRLLQSSRNIIVCCFSQVFWYAPFASTRLMTNLKWFHVCHFDQDFFHQEWYDGLPNVLVFDSEMETTYVQAGMWSWNWVDLVAKSSQMLCGVIKKNIRTYVSHKSSSQFENVVSFVFECWL